MQKKPFQARRFLLMLFLVFNLAWAENFDDIDELQRLNDIDDGLLQFDFDEDTHSDWQQGIDEDLADLEAGNDLDDDSEHDVEDNHSGDDDSNEEYSDTEDTDDYDSDYYESELEDAREDEDEDDAREDEDDAREDEDEDDAREDEAEDEAEDDDDD